MARRDQRRRRGRFIGPFGRGFGVYWNRTGHRLRAYGFGALALIACWLVIVPGYVWIVQPGYSIAAAARWAAAALLDEIGLHDWRWRVSTTDGLQRWRSQFVRYEEWHLLQVDAVMASIWIGVAIATVVVVILGIIAFVGLKRTGEAAGDSRVLRGRRLSSDTELAATLKREGVASELRIGKVPLIKDKEAYNTLLVGAQGTGKTSATEALLEGIEARGEPAVIYDYGPGLLPRFFNAARGDLILNPRDERSVVWSPWSEIDNAADCTAIAEGFIPRGDERDPFWGVAGRLLFAEVLDRLRNDPERSVEKLLHVLLRMTQDEIRAVLEGTNAAKLFEEGAERTGKSVEINTSVYVKALGLLRADAGKRTDFSIQRYIEALDAPAPAHGRPWLWLTTDPRNASVLRPLLSCWTNAVATSLLSLPERLDRRLWFVLDKLATLHELPLLASFMQNARKRGGSAWITLQTPVQLRSIYNHGDAQTILNGCQTQAIFRISDAEGAEWASRSIGQVELEEVRESTRLSSHGQRGHEIHLAVDTRVSQVVLAAEISMTPDNQCYVKLPEDRPVVLTSIEPRAPLSSADRVPAFLPMRDESRTAAEVLAASGVTTARPAAPAASGRPKRDQWTSGGKRRASAGGGSNGQAASSDAVVLPLFDHLGEHASPDPSADRTGIDKPRTWE